MPKSDDLLVHGYGGVVPTSLDEMEAEYRKLGFISTPVSPELRPGSAIKQRQEFLAGQAGVRARGALQGDDGLPHE